VRAPGAIEGQQASSIERAEWRTEALMDCASMMLDVEGVGAVNGALACPATLTFDFRVTCSISALWLDD
jgi:hypothetical protein